VHKRGLATALVDGCVELSTSSVGNLSAGSSSERSSSGVLGWSRAAKLRGIHGVDLVLVGNLPLRDKSCIRVDAAQQKVVSNSRTQPAWKLELMPARLRGALGGGVVIVVAAAPAAATADATVRPCFCRCTVSFR